MIKQRVQGDFMQEFQLIETCPRDQWLLGVNKDSPQDVFVFRLIHDSIPERDIYEMTYHGKEKEIYAPDYWAYIPRIPQN